MQARELERRLFSGACSYQSTYFKHKLPAMFFVLFSIMFISSVYSEKAILNDTRTKLMT